jgi:hypothetical protein
MEIKAPLLYVITQGNLDGLGETKAKKTDAL